MRARKFQFLPHLVRALLPSQSRGSAGRTGKDLRGAWDICTQHLAADPTGPCSLLGMGRAGWDAPGRRAPGDSTDV